MDREDAALWGGVLLGILIAYVGLPGVVWLTLRAVPSARRNARDKLATVVDEKTLSIIRGLRGTPGAARDAANIVLAASGVNLPRLIHDEVSVPVADAILTDGLGLPQS